MSAAHRMIAAILAVAAPAAAAAAEAAARSGTVELVRGGRTDWVISLRSEGAGPAGLAAEELRDHIEAMSGARLEVARGAAAGPAVVVGLRKDLDAADRALLPAPASGHDGYAIAVAPAAAGRPPRVVVAGEEDRGVLYGAYDLLERLGCLWPYPSQDPEDPGIVPRRGDLEIPLGSWATASPFRYRIANGSAWLFEVSLDAARRQLVWAARNRYNAIGWQCDSRTPLLPQYERLRSTGLIDELERRGMVLHGPGHSFDQFLKDSEHLASHPEWFGLRDGKRVGQSFLGSQFCWSSAEARARFVENVAAFVEAAPALRILYFAPFDGGKCCECDECRRVGSGRLLLRLAGEVIERLETVAPGVLVETLGGYEPVSEPPRDAEIHPRLRILWAHWGRWHGRSYGDPAYDRKANLDAWRAASTGGMTVCQYYTDNFAEPWILPPFISTIRGDRAYLEAIGVDSVYVLMWPPGYWWNHGLNGHLAGLGLHDPSLDLDRALERYALRYFGPDAGPLLGAYLAEWARDLDLAYRLRGDARNSDREVLARQRRDCIEPAVAATRGDRILARRVGKVEKLHALAEMLAELHCRRREARSLREAGNLPAAREKLAETERYAEEVLGRFKALAELDQGLIDRNEVSGFIPILLRNPIQEERKLLEAR